MWQAKAEGVVDSLKDTASKAGDKIESATSDAKDSLKSDGNGAADNVVRTLLQLPRRCLRPVSYRSPKRLALLLTPQLLFCLVGGWLASDRGF